MFSTLRHHLIISVAATALALVGGVASAQETHDTFRDPPLVSSGGQTCLSTISIVGQPRLNTTIQFCINGSPNCHACIWASKNAGPTVIGNITIPIGFPLIDYFDLGSFPPSGQICTPIPIPNDPNLVGRSFYFTNASFSPTAPQNTIFAPQFVVTIVQ